ncbi:sensory transduction protein lytt [Heliomicrobium modesticaldum Ice1]|uniref:Sensory transduction protein lytt n=1 Tax=Heliobacterium modesticaldum (strain ATCC 51547 / Ice1) TaxID=498761 RepID=B0TCJ6_HELMI|nr:LytTR family DNA-binding domain-containing protein [Heliomicrobium modesticaldum]ABZ84022.1 sensory transduction protein lytt [Heliomicrobium modesticaldum Ice1]
MDIPFENLSGIIKAISRILPWDVSIAISEHNRFVYYQPSSSVDLKIKPGDLLKEGSVTMQALHSGGPISMYMEEDLYGVPYFAISTPLLELGLERSCLTAVIPPFLANEIVKLPRHKFLIGKSDEKWIPIPLKEIAYIDSENGRTRIFTEDDQYINKHTLFELEWMLPRNQYVRCHRAYIVNVDKITEILPDFHSTFLLSIKTKGKTQIPVSQRYASHLRRLMGF